MNRRTGTPAQQGDRDRHGLVHLSQLSHQLLSQLSGGQRQRMAHARSLGLETGTTVWLSPVPGALTVPPARAS